jgi:hypothetical protein
MMWLWILGGFLYLSVGLGIAVHTSENGTRESVVVTLLWVVLCGLFWPLLMSAGAVAMLLKKLLA